ncbi:MAG TPA: phospholipase D family protein [Burkholderiaceae bacterium]|nr:phospholipase D family protein [Burkholderiaceae bacterium]
MRLRTCRLWLLLSVALAGCAMLPARPTLPPTHAIADVAGSPLAHALDVSVPADKRWLSGLRLLPEGPTAFNARVALARNATYSLDVQYYYIAQDRTGFAFLRELRDAAMRGVRVRLIVDDLYAAGADDLLAGLAAYPNVEVRIFNPLPSRDGSFKTRLIFSLHEFERINHRMHNKVFIADNTFAVTGGRNIANEYFMRSEEANFVDLDVLSAGPVVRQLSALFDRYWNSEQVFPIERLVARQVPAEEARRRFDDIVRDAPADVEERPNDVLGATPVRQQLEACHMVLTWAPARAFADTPTKVAGLKEEEKAHTVTAETLAIFAQAHESVAISSPYFIPGERGLEMIRAFGATQQNGRIILITNSLGATDEPLVHASYSRYRVDMLKAGVIIYEVSPTLPRRGNKLGNFGRSVAMLHAKAAAIDQRIVYIGSMNLDARSSRINTEIGMVIESPELAATLKRLSTEDVKGDAYRLRLAAGGENIEWLETGDDGKTIVHAEEPGSSFWLSFKLWLLAPFVSDDLL